MKSEVIRNISTLITGTALAQLIPILLQPILRRLYSPEIYGSYAVYLSMVGIIYVLTSLRYELAIAHPRKDKEAVNIFFIAQFFNLCITILILVLFIVFRTWISHILNLGEEHTYLILLVPLGSFLFNLYQCLNYWLIRKKQFLKISLNKLIRRGTEGIGQTGLRYFQLNAGLVIGDLAGHLSNVISGLMQVANTNLRLSSISFSKIKYVARKYSDYPKYNLGTTFLSACSYLVPAIFINNFFGPEYTGQFDLSKLVLSIPLALIAGSVSNVLLQRVAELYRSSKSIMKELSAVLAVVLFIALLEIIVIRLFALEIFTIFFGKQWTLSADISRMLVWSYTFNFVLFSFNTVFISLRKIKLYSVWQVLYFFGIFSLVLFRGYEYTDFIRIYVLIEVFCYATNFLLLTYIIIDYERKVRA